MAETAVLYRRNTKQNLTTYPPLAGEVVFALDTEEYGAVENNVLLWRKHLSDFTQVQADLLYQPLNADIVIDANYVHTDYNFSLYYVEKLGTIEDGATADQTKVDIDALNIDAGTLGGYSSSDYVLSNTANIKDNLITINSDVVNTPFENAGIEINRGSESTVSVLWNETSDTWTLSNDGVNYYEIITTNSDVGQFYTAGYGLELNGLEFSHINIDGSGHVPETSTISLGKVLTAGATAGVYSWEDPDDTYGSWSIADNNATPNTESILSGVEVKFAGAGATGTLYNTTTNTMNITSTDTVYDHPNHSGDVVSLADGLTTIQPNVVTANMLQQIDSQHLIGRSSGGIGNVEIINKTGILSIINVEDGAEVNVQPDWTATTGDAFILNKPSTFPANDATITIVAGNGLITGGSFTTDQLTNANITLSHADTSTQISIDNAGAQVIQDINVDEFGHITALGSTTITNALIGSEPAFTKNSAFNKDFSVDGISTLVSRSDHTHSLNALGAEPAFTKNTAFNKDFGIGGSATTVSRSDHNHDFINLNGIKSDMIPNDGDGLVYNDLTSEWESRTLINVPTIFQDIYYYTATAGQTVFTGGDELGELLAYVPNSITVIIDGFTIREMDYTASDGLNITLDIGCNVGDQIMIIAYNNVALPDVVQKTGDVMSGDLEVPNINVLNTTTTVDLLVSGTLTETSARRYKQNIEPLYNSLEKVNLLEGVSYNKIGSIKEEIGLIAEDVEKVIPEVVTKIGNVVEGINYARLVALLIESTKELTQELKTQKSINKNLDNRMKILEKLL